MAELNCSFSRHRELIKRMRERNQTKIEFRITEDQLKKKGWGFRT